jgi:hypothetical protein
MALRNTLREATRQDFPVPGARIPFTIERTKDVLAHNLIYRVYRKDMPDQKVGYAKLSGDGKSVMDVVIAQEFQRQGIASALYDFIERDQHITLRPSPMWQSPQGKAFWAARHNRRVTEDLRDWFGKGKQGGVGGGGWDRYNTKGERIGKCGGAEDRGTDGEGKPKCLSKQKAAQLRAQGGKKAIANAVKRKKAQDPVTDRKGTGNAPRPISNRIGESMLAEKNVPTNPSLWSRAKAEAKKRFDVYPSAYANGWAAKWYKKRGGGWKSEKTESYDITDPSQREWGTDSSVAIFKSMTPGEMQESSHTVLDKPTLSVEEIAKKHRVSPDEIQQQLAKGLKIEMEHTSDASVAREIALDHIAERPDYYDQLAKLESRQMVREFTQGKHVLLVAVPKNPNEGDGKGYWKVGDQVYRGPIKNVLFDIAKEPMDKRWESSWEHFKKNFDVMYGRFYKKADKEWNRAMKESTHDTLDIIFESIQNMLGESCGCVAPLRTEASEYQGRKVTLNKPFRTSGGPKKFSVYVKNDKGNVVKVNFGDPKLSIKRDDPARRRNFRARHGCDNPGPRWKAKYWSCKFWSKKSVTDLIKETPKK